MAKNGREKIKLQSSESSDFRTTTKNKKLHPEKLEVMLFDKKLKKHVMFKEAKLK